MVRKTPGCLALLGFFYSFFTKGQYEQYQRHVVSATKPPRAVALMSKSTNVQRISPRGEAAAPRSGGGLKGGEAPFPSSFFLT